MVVRCVHRSIWGVYNLLCLLAARTLDLYSIHLNSQKTPALLMPLMLQIPALRLSDQKEREDDDSLLNGQGD